VRERLKHRAAFDYYYALGDKRSLAKVARKFKVSVQSLVKWSKNFHWKERIEKRDRENAERIEKKTDQAIVKTKLEYRNDIRKSFAIVLALLGTAIEKGKLKSTLKIKSIKDIKDLIDSKEKLIKADLLLMGEPTHRFEHDLKGIAEKIRDDPEACRLATQLLEQITTGEGDAGGAGVAD